MRPIAGVVTALATPFDGAVDLTALAELVAWQVREGCGALAACTVIGEAPTLARDEVEAVLRTCVATAGGRVPILAGISDCDTQACLRAAVSAETAGVDALVVAMPPYNKPSQEGLCRHVAAIAAASRLPIILYNAPGRSIVDLAPVTLARMAALDSVLGCIDERTGSRPCAEIAAGRERMRMYGCDADGPAGMVGRSGWFSAVANVAPRLCSEMWHALAREDWRCAMAIDRSLRPLVDAIQRETEASCVKHALSGLLPGFSPAVRLPLVPVAPETADAIASALAIASRTPHEARP